MRKRWEGEKVARHAIFIRNTDFSVTDKWWCCLGTEKKLHISYMDVDEL